MYAAEDSCHTQSMRFICSLNNVAFSADYMFTAAESIVN